MCPSPCIEAGGEGSTGALCRCHTIVLRTGVYRWRPASTSPQPLPVPTPRDSRASVKSQPNRKLIILPAWLPCLAASPAWPPAPRCRQRIWLGLITPSLPPSETGPWLPMALMPLLWRLRQLGVLAALFNDIWVRSTAALGAPPPGASTRPGRRRHPPRRPGARGHQSGDLRAGASDTRQPAPRSSPPGGSRSSSRRPQPPPHSPGEDEGRHALRGDLQAMIGARQISGSVIRLDRLRGRMCRPADGRTDRRTGRQTDRDLTQFLAVTQCLAVPRSARPFEVGPGPGLAQALPRGLAGLCLPPINSNPTQPFLASPPLRASGAK